MLHTEGSINVLVNHGLHKIRWVLDFRSNCMSSLSFRNLDKENIKQGIETVASIFQPEFEDETADKSTMALR